MAQIMELREFISLQLETLTQQTLANVLGVTKSQIQKYYYGDTKTCNDKVVDSIYDNFDVLINYFNDENHYIHTRELREKFDATHTSH